MKKPGRLLWCISLLLVVLWAVPSSGAERRCNELGANCVCSEPLNTDSMGKTGSGNGRTYNPADSTTKECTWIEFADWVPGTNGDQMSAATASSDTTMFSKLPKGHTNTYVWKGPNGWNGEYTWYLGHTGLGAYSGKRVVMRYYIYYSPDYDFKWSGSCTNAKTGGIGPQTDGGPTGLYWESNSGWEHIIHWEVFGGGDPGPAGPNTMDAYGPSVAEKRGRWWRHEVVVENFQGGPAPNGFKIQMWATNVTDGGAPIKVFDSMGTYTRDGFVWGAPNNLTPSRTLTNLLHFGYRAGGCNGYMAMSHFMIANWDTNAGQMIGPASEVEGGGSSAPPAPPLNLKAW